MSDICAAELDALSPFELELVARALQLRQPLTASALSARLASLSAQQQSTQLVSCVFSLADCDSDGVTTRAELVLVARAYGLVRALLRIPERVLDDLTDDGAAVLADMSADADGALTEAQVQDYFARRRPRTRELLQSVVKVLRDAEAAGSGNGDGEDAAVDTPRASNRKSSANKSLARGGRPVARASSVVGVRFHACPGGGAVVDARCAHVAGRRGRLECVGRLRL